MPTPGPYYWTDTARPFFVNFNHIFSYNRIYCFNWQYFANVSPVLSMQQDSSVAMTAPALRSWQQTRLGGALQTEHMTGAHPPTGNLPECLQSPTGSMMSSASTTAACGLTTATTTSNIGPPVTAGVTSHPAQVCQLFYTIRYSSLIIFLYYIR